MLACEAGKQREYADELGSVRDAFREEPLYIEMLASPSIPLDERLGAIDAAFGERLSEHVLSYLKLLCEKGRIGCFIDTVDRYEALLRASERVSEAKITAAVELTEDEKKRLIGRLEEKLKGRVIAEYFVDPELIGGLIVEIDGNIMDGSLRRRLYEVKEVMNR